MPEEHSIFEINQFFDKLTLSWDEAAARELINLYHGLPQASTKKSIKNKVKSSGSFTGFTREHGNVTLEDKSQEAPKVKGEKEEQYRRVGGYKIERYQFKNANCSVLIFYNFFAADLTTMSWSEERVDWALWFRKDNREPIQFVKTTYIPVVTERLGVTHTTFDRECEILFENQDLWPEKTGMSKRQKRLFKVLAEMAFALIVAWIACKIQRWEITALKLVGLSASFFVYSLAWDLMPKLYRRVVKNKKFDNSGSP